MSRQSTLERLKVLLRKLFDPKIAEQHSSAEKKVDEGVWSALSTSRATTASVPAPSVSPATELATRFEGAKARAGAAFPFPSRICYNAFDGENARTSYCRDSEPPGL